MNNYEFLFTIKSSHSKRFKYLYYVPKPIHLNPADYDLVDDEEFCKPDGRIPLLILTQFGIFPNATSIGKKDYQYLEGLEGQRVGFLCRGYLSNRERRMVMEVMLDEESPVKFHKAALQLNLRIWDVLLRQSCHQNEYS